MARLDSPAPDLLEARELRKSYGRRAVLHDVSLQAQAGEIVGIVGENGSGKSTLLRLLAGIERPDRGEVVRHGPLGYCPQEPQLIERLSVRENLAYFAAAYGMRGRSEAVNGAATRLRLAPEDRTLVAELSGGARQKLNLLVALMCEPAVLLLDEPYAAFDWESYLVFWELALELRGRGCAVVLVSHLLYDRRQLDRVLRLVGGRIVCD